MKRIVIGLGAVLLGVILASPVMAAGLTSPSKPHGIISTALPPGPNYYPVQIIWLDGRYLSSNGQRSSLWVTPGKHTIGFRAIIDPRYGPNVMLSPADSNMKNLSTLTVDVKRGHIYYFGAKIPNANVNKWQPVVIKTEKE